ncbi:MAG: hypothetical protein ACRCWB_04710 [Enterovibrio sp.]
MEKRWGSQQLSPNFSDPERLLDEDTLNQAVANAADIFNQPIAASYDSFINKISGFDWQEEARNQPTTPLVSWQQAFEAAGGILGGAWNAYNHYLAGDVYNLHPKTNPGKGSFSQWFDDLTSRAYRYMAGEEQDSAEDLKLDETLAKTAEELLTKAQRRARHKPFVSVNSKNAQQEHAAHQDQDAPFSQQQAFNDAENFDHSANQARLEAMNSISSLPVHLLILPPSTKLNDPPKKKKKAPKIDPFMRRLRARWGAQMPAEEGLQIEKRAAAQLKMLLQAQEEQYQHANVTSKKSIRPLVKPGSAAWEKLTRQQKRAAKKEWESNQAVSQEVFGSDHEESRLQFIKKISGFDLEEEMRHFPHQELVSSQQAAEAAGSLLGSAWEKHNSLWSEAYDLNLQPKTNPGQKGFFDWFFMHYSQLFDSIAEKFAPFDADDWATMSDEKLDQFLAEEFLRFYAKDPTLFEDVNENEKLIKRFQQFVQGLYTLLAPTSAAQKRAFSFDECASGVDGDNWSQQAACTSASMNTGAELFAASGITEAATPPPNLGIKINLQEAAKEVTHDPDGSLDTESKQPLVSSGAFLFGGADAMPVNRLRDDAEVEQYKYQYAEWARAHAQHTRTKRRVNHNKKITPEMLVGLKFSQLNSQLSNKQLQGLQKVLNTPVKPDEDLSKRNEYLFQMLNKLSKSNQNVRAHIDDTLDALQMLLMERSETFRRSYTQYWYANEQSLKHDNDFFYHKAVEDFINPPGDMHRAGAAQKMVKSLRDKKDLILTEILNKQYQGEELDHRVLGMVFANLDINNFSNKGGSRAQAWTKTVIDWSNDLKTSQGTFDKLHKHLNQEGISSKLLQPYYLNQGAILDRAAGLAGANRGMCQYVATAALMALRNGDLEGLNNLHDTLGKLKKLYAQDVVSAYKVSAHLDEANKRMQDSYFFSEQKQAWESTRNLVTPVDSYENTLKLITTSENGVRIVFQSEINGKKAGHAVAVGKVAIDGEVVRVFIDVNMGIVPCYNDEQLIHAFTESLKAMPGYDANDPSQKFASFGALEMTKENIAIIENIQHDKVSWLKHGVLDVDKILSSPLTPQITKDPSWDGYIKNLDPVGKIASMDADFKVYKEPVTHESFDVLLDRTYKARQKDLPIDIQKMPGGDLANYIHTSQAKRTKQQLLDSFVNQYHKNMMTAQQDPVRSSAKKIAVDDTSNSRKLVIDTDGSAAADKKSLGTTLLKALGGSSAKKTVKINVDAAGSATKVEVETPQAESQQKINLLLEKFNTYQSAVETMQQQNQASPANKVLAGLLESNAAKINKQQIDKIDLENQKIAQQLQDVQVRISELIKAKGYSPDLFELDKSIDISNTNDITIRSKQNHLEKVTIPLNINLSNSLKSIKKSIVTRVTAFSNALDDINPNIKSGAKNVWMASGKAMQVAGKVMAIYNMASLMKQVDSLPNMDKVAQTGFSIRMIDLAVDNIGNALGTVNWAVKTIAAPVKALSTAARIGSYASMGVSLAVNLIEIGLHSYSFSVAATDIEKKMASLSLTCAVLQTSLTIAAMAVCTAFPLAAPLFMIVGFLINYIQGEIQNSMLAQDLANSSFEQFEKELTEILELLKNPNYLFDESSQSMTIVNPNMPYTELTVSADSIQMVKHGKPFAASFLKSFESTLKKAPDPIMKVGEPSTPDNPSNLYSSINPNLYKNLEYNAKKISPAYREGFDGFSSDNEVWLRHSKNIFYSTSANGWAFFTPTAVRTLNNCDKSDRSLITQNRIEDGTIDQCLRPETKTEKIIRHKLLALAAGETRHVMINGHPQRPIYFTPKCTQTSVGGYTYNPENAPLVTKFDTCPRQDNNKWKIRKRLANHT